MKGLVAVGLVAVGVLGGSLLRPLGVDAQQADFRFQPGDAVTIDYSGTSLPCQIDRFYGSFVSCKRQPGAPDVVQRPFVYNLSTAISVTLVKKAG